MAGRICEEILGRWSSSAPPRDCPLRIAIAVLHDYHMLGKRMVLSVLHAAGYPVLDYGGGVAPEVAARRALDDGVEVLLVSTLMLLSAIRVRELMDLFAPHPQRPRVAVGGAPFRLDAALRRGPGGRGTGPTPSPPGGPARNRHAVAFCTHFAGEARAALDEAGLHATRLHIFPARCYSTKTTWEGIASVIERVVDEVARVDVFCSACCFAAPGPDSVPESVRIHLLPLCASLVAPQALLDDLVGSRAYVLTSGWLRSWRQEVEAWGFDEAGAREFFRECADSLVLLDTGVVPEAEALLGDLATRMDLPARAVPVGTEVLRLRLERVAREADLEAALALERAADSKDADSLCGLRDALTREVALLDGEIARRFGP